MAKAAIMCYYDSGVYSSRWPYVRVAFDARFRAIEWRFEDQIPEGFGVLETRQLPSDVVGSIVAVAETIPASVTAAIERTRRESRSPASTAK